MNNKSIKRAKDLKSIMGFKFSSKALLAKMCGDDHKYIQIIKEFLATMNQSYIEKSRESFKEWEKNKRKNSEQLILWTLWWQGYDNMPEIVKMCYRTQEKYAESNNTKIILLSKDNICDYINIPQVILDKVERKIITLTHFSDIIRIYLLEQYGGAWIDSTLYIDNEISKTDFQKYDFFSFHLSPDAHQPVGTGQVLTECKWSGFMLYSKYPHNPLFIYLKESITAYWNKHDAIIDYFIMNFLIRILYENVEEARNMIDKVEYNNPCLYVLNALMNKPYSNKEWDMLRSETDFFKLSWKEQYIQESVDEQMTYYEKLSVISHI